MKNNSEIPESKMKISPYEPIFGIILSISLTILFLGFPQVLRISWESIWIPVFDTGVVRGLWLPILLWAILEIAAEVMKLVERQYTMRLASVIVIISVLQVVFAVVVFGNSNILNPEFISHMESINTNSGAIGSIFNAMIMRPNLVIMAVLLIVLFFETLDVVVKAFRSKR